MSTFGLIKYNYMDSLRVGVENGSVLFVFSKFPRAATLSVCGCLAPVACFLFQNVRVTTRWPSLGVQRGSGNGFVMAVSLVVRRLVANNCMMA